MQKNANAAKPGKVGLPKSVAINASESPVLKAFAALGLPGLAVAVAGLMVSYGVGPAWSATIIGHKLKRIPGPLGSVRFAVGKAITSVGLALSFPALAYSRLPDPARRAAEEAWLERQTAPARRAAEDIEGQARCQPELALIAAGEWEAAARRAKALGAAPATQGLARFVLDRIAKASISVDDPKGLAAAIEISPDHFGGGLDDSGSTRQGWLSDCSDAKAKKCVGLLVSFYRARHKADLGADSPYAAEMPPGLNLPDLKAKLMARKQEAGAPSGSAPSGP